jgi:hypothetical protein
MKGRDEYAPTSEKLHPLELDYAASPQFNVEMSLLGINESYLLRYEEKFRDGLLPFSNLIRAFTPWATPSNLWLTSAERIPQRRRCTFRENRSQNHA